MTTTSRQARAGLPLLLLSLILLLAACAAGATTTPSATSVPSAGPAGSGSAAPAMTATPFLVRDFTTDPKELTLRVPAALAVTNDGPTIHNIAIRDAQGTVLATTPDLRTGESASLPLDLAPGTYTFFCSLAGHESLGIKGTLTVSR